MLSGMFLLSPETAARPNTPPMITGVRSIIFASGERISKPQAIPGRWPTPGSGEVRKLPFEGRSRPVCVKAASAMQPVVAGRLSACRNPPDKAAASCGTPATRPPLRSASSRDTPKAAAERVASAAVTIPNGSQPTGTTKRVDEPDRVFHSPQALGIDRFSLDLKLFDAASFCRRANSPASISPACSARFNLSRSNSSTATGRHAERRPTGAGN